MDILNDTLLFDLDIIERELAEGRESLVQFQAPPTPPAKFLKFGENGELLDGPEVDIDAYFTRLNGLCARYGDRLTVRFYGFHDGDFDANLVLRLPEVRALTVNCLHEAANLELLGTLPKLTRLGLGVFRMEDKNILARLPLERIEDLVVEETQTKALDLAPLARATALRRLMLVGHRKNIDALGALDRLESLSFAPVKGVPLDFLNPMQGLRSLKLVLGGTETLEPVTLPGLRELALTMVKGFTDLGDLSRFSGLERLLVQDQQHIERLEVGAANVALRHIWLFNCRKLSALPGLGSLPALESLHAVRTALSLPAIRLPQSLSHLSLFGGKRREEAAERAAIEARGLIAEPHPEMPFFYK